MISEIAQLFAEDAMIHFDCDLKMTDTPAFFAATSR